MEVFYKLPVNIDDRPTLATDTSGVVDQLAKVSRDLFDIVIDKAAVGDTASLIEGMRDDTTTDAVGVTDQHSMTGQHAVLHPDASGWPLGSAPLIDDVEPLGIVVIYRSVTTNRSFNTGNAGGLGPVPAEVGG